MKPLLNILNSWKKPEEDEEFVDKAVDSLFKKLKTKKGAIEELEHAINNPTLPSKCVTIPRSLDGRLQVSHRKGLPHVIYCRIFRWSDLQSHHELKAIDSCKFSFSSKQSEVCVNPYHYERVELAQNNPSVTIKKEKLNTQVQNLPCPTVPVNNSFYQNHYFDSQSAPNLCYTPDSSTKDQENFYPNAPNISTPNNYTPGSIFNNSSSYPAGYQYYANSYVSSAYGSMLGSPQASENSMDTNNSETLYRNISYQEPLNWCSLVYYELNQRIGEVFNATTNKIYVDGYTNPCNAYGRRFCLGMFSNINRIPSVEKCRKHIGKGLHIFNENGDIYIENLSECPIFIQSRNSNHENKYHPNTVCKILPGYNLKVFQSKLFAELLRESVDLGYDSVYDLANMCCVKASFVKGWGAEYYRQEVSACPCWIEIRLNGAFQWLDKVLKEMGSSSNPVTSVS